MKSILVLTILCAVPIEVTAETNPNNFIDSRAQAMVSVITNNQNLYASDPEQFKDKINTISFIRG